MRVAAHSAVWGSFVDSPSAVRRLTVSSAFRVPSAHTRCNGSSNGNGLPLTGPPARAKLSGTWNGPDAGPALAGSDGDAIAPSANSLKIESPPPGRVPAFALVHEARVRQRPCCNRLWTARVLDTSHVVDAQRARARCLRLHGASVPSITRQRRAARLTLMDQSPRLTKTTAP